MNFLNGGAEGGEAVRCSAWLDHRVVMYLMLLGIAFALWMVADMVWREIKWKRERDAQEKEQMQRQASQETTGQSLASPDGRPNPCIPEEGCLHTKQTQQREAADPSEPRP